MMALVTLFNLTENVTKNATAFFFKYDHIQYPTVRSGSVRCGAVSYGDASTVTEILYII